MALVIVLYHFRVPFLFGDSGLILSAGIFSSAIIIHSAITHKKQRKNPT